MVMAHVLNGVVGPHQNSRLVVEGEVDGARATLLLLHGRGDSPGGILSLAHELELPPDWIVVAPEAVGRQWYPQRFIMPQQQNQPFLSSALQVVEQSFAQLLQWGIEPKQVIVAGFSQGACLASEYCARNAQQYGGLVIFSGGLIGSDEEVHSNQYSEDLAQTPVFNGCDEDDFHIPKARVLETTKILNQLGAQVEERIYSGLGHRINQEEIDFLQQMIDRV